MATSAPLPRYRLGFAVKFMGRPLPSADLRRIGSHPHLRQSIAYLLDALPYLREERFAMYRLASSLAPYGTHPDYPAMRASRQHEEARDELEQLGRAFREAAIRISTHPSQYVVLDSPDPDLVARSTAELEADADLLDALLAGPEARVIVHVGGRYDDPLAARERWIRAYEAAPGSVRRRLALENDERLFGLSDVVWIAERCGVPICLDLHHHRLHPEGRDLGWEDALRLAAASWPAGIRPKAHLSSVREGGRFGAHADLIDPDDLLGAIRALPCDYDLMLEAKSKDLAVLAARADLARLDPALAASEERGAGS